MTDPAAATPPFLTSSLLDALPGVRHGFFTRRGGVSRGIYDSLNVGPGSKDDPAAVVENRRRAAEAMGLPLEALCTTYQVHSAVVRFAETPWGERRPEGDGVVAVRPDVLCGALAADCAPVLLADAEARVVAAAHAGWKGALGGVVEAAVAAMVERGARRGRIVAAVGPCIARASYETGPEFFDRFASEDATAARFFDSADAAGKRRFDLPAYVLDRLARAGVERAEALGRDTCAEADQFFSNRRAFKAGEPDFGRLLSAIRLT